MRRREACNRDRLHISPLGLKAAAILKDRRTKRIYKDAVELVGKQVHPIDFTKILFSAHDKVKYEPLELR